MRVEVESLCELVRQHLHQQQQQQQQHAQAQQHQQAQQQQQAATTTIAESIVARSDLIKIIKLPLRRIDSAQRLYRSRRTVYRSGNV
jgi:hypothetical protein